MIEAGDRAGLSLEALAKLPARGEMSWENLDGDRAVEARVSGTVDLAHAARPKGGEHLVGPEQSAGTERHRTSPRAGSIASVLRQSTLSGQSSYGVSRCSTESEA
jgi:hypothetical protein